MSYRSLKSVLLACSGAAVLLAASTAANAGGLALHEQSAYGQGSSFAGVAAGGSLSSMFWNPATMTQVPGIQFESVLSGIIPYASNSVGTPSTLGAFGGTGDTAVDALVPAGYASWQVNPDLWLGLSFNAPYGLSVTFPNIWAGRDYAAGSSSLKTYNATPSFAYAINNWISIGAGVQIQYGKAELSRGITLPGPTFANSNLSGDGWAYGFTAGLTLTPTPFTTVGLGYRSQLNQKIDGSTVISAPLAAFSNPDAHTTIKLPDIVSLGIRHKLTPQWTVMGTVEWSNWSRIGTSNVVTSSGAPVTVGATPVQVHFDFKDGWFFSVGAEYQWSQALALRGGIGFEKSPITDQVRVPLLPDNDRLWLSLGASYQVTTKLALDFAYSHIFVKSTPISVVAGNPTFNGATAYTGSVSAQVDIVSVGLKYRWDDPAPVRTTKLITK